MPKEPLSPSGASPSRSTELPASFSIHGRSNAHVLLTPAPFRPLCHPIRHPSIGLRHPILRLTTYMLSMCFYSGRVLRSSLIQLFPVHQPRHSATIIYSTISSCLRPSVLQRVVSSGFRRRMTGRGRAAILSRHACSIFRALPRTNNNHQLVALHDGTTHSCGMLS
ncbi:hypothetical protein BV25DRAFT_1136631 [Artomyces pyxidatus]|uniref:Uncharacterized protein n=1 Tax=Artomyces pyxidatus TaxID=48021 RepID=A0ACB8SST3_9AGAM|nr:hypothetical protein BV25DRAFT_1136631 [Artomyces pyxidatus]